MVDQVKGFDAQAHTLDSPHYRIHQGRMFNGGFFDAAVAASGSLDILMRTGAIPAHIIFSVSAGADARGQIFEGVTASADGTPLGVFNNNRPKAADNPSLSILFHTPTITDLGLDISPGGFIPGGSGFLTAGGSGDFGRERNLMKNTDYLFRVTNLSTGVSPISLSVQFYEPKAG